MLVGAAERWIFSSPFIAYWDRMTLWLLKELLIAALSVPFFGLHERTSFYKFWFGYRFIQTQLTSWPRSRYFFIWCESPVAHIVIPLLAIENRGLWLSHLEFHYGTPNWSGDTATWHTAQRFWTNVSGVVLKDFTTQLYWPLIVITQTPNLRASRIGNFTLVRADWNKLFVFIKCGAASQRINRIGCLRKVTKKI
jgi:hypothetical protein